MKKIYALLTFLIIVGIFIPAVSAEEVVIDEEYGYNIDTSSQTPAYSFTGSGYQRGVKSLILTNMQNRQNMGYIGIVVPEDVIDGTTLVEGVNELEYTLYGDTNPCHIYISRQQNYAGSVTSSQVLIFFENWDTKGNTGSTTITFNKVFMQIFCARDASATAHVEIRSIHTAYDERAGKITSIVVSSYTDFRNHLIVTDQENGFYNISIIKQYDNLQYPSRLQLEKNGSTVFYNEGNVNNNFLWEKSKIDTVKIITSLRTFAENLPDEPGAPDDPDAPDNTTVTVYVRNSQTGVAIANSRVVIDALVDGDYYPVVNRTEPSGIFSVTLQPTGGGMPNPDSYRLIASADGYINQVPEINFTVDEYITSIYCSLDPITGGPEDENNTFIDFFVRDMSANPIRGATVNFGGYTLITNSAGYTVLEVGKNSMYTYTVSKSGYGSLTGNVVIGAAPRHTINTVLAPSVTPTKPTPIPTLTPISPTPTMTAPTGEPVSNWLEWFAAHFGRILGGGVEIGKIFMWLCFSVPVGVYVAKEAKAGAAGFMAGAGVVTLFFVLIGWVPIWLLVLVALIIGLLYAKVFNNSDTGGGR